MSSVKSLRVDHFADPAQYCAYYKTYFGPTIACPVCADAPDRTS